MFTYDPSSAIPWNLENVRAFLWPANRKDSFAVAATGISGDTIVETLFPHPQQPAPWTSPKVILTMQANDFLVSFIVPNAACLAPVHMPGDGALVQLYAVGRVTVYQIDPDSGEAVHKSTLENFPLRALVDPYVFQSSGSLFHRIVSAIPHADTNESKSLLRAFPVLEPPAYKTLLASLSDARVSDVAVFFDIKPSDKPTTPPAGHIAKMGANALCDASFVQPGPAIRIHPMSQDALRYVQRLHDYT